jgi:DNA mismatch repair protein MutH
MGDSSIGRDASWGEIKRASDALLGHSFGDIIQAGLDTDADRTKVKGQLGELLEEYYGMENDNDPLPDFRKAGLELKCKPLKISYGDYIYPKEPLSVGMIDYEEVAETEYWRDIDKLRKKFLNLLIVWFVHDDGPREDFRFIWWQSWSPGDHLDEQIQSEYAEVRRQVLEGEHLSESEAGNDILQTCPKHNSDFSSRESGSYVVDGHPVLDKPERRSWRIPTRFLVKMLADDAGIETVHTYGTEYIEQEALWQRARERASDSEDIGEFLPDGSTQSNLRDFDPE